MGRGQQEGSGKPGTDGQRTEGPQTAVPHDLPEALSGGAAAAGIGQIGYAVPVQGTRGPEQGQHPEPAGHERTKGRRDLDRACKAQRHEGQPGPEQAQC